jgi:antitoxin CptB
MLKAKVGSAAPDLSNSRRKRLLFRSWHRGTQESDFILGSFADSCLAGFSSVQLERFEALLECSDPDLFDWILGGSAPPVEHDHDVLCLLRAFCAQSVNRGQPS